MELQQSSRGERVRGSTGGGRFSVGLPHFAAGLLGCLYDLTWPFPGLQLRKAVQWREQYLGDRQLDESLLTVSGSGPWAN